MRLNDNGLVSNLQQGLTDELGTVLLCIRWSCHALGPHPFDSFQMLRFTPQPTA